MRSYSYYAYAALRAYFEGRTTVGSSDAARANYEASVQAMDGMSDNVRQVLKEVYTHEAALTIAVQDTARKHDLRVNDLWTLVAKAEKEFAIARGLI